MIHGYHGLVDLLRSQVPEVTVDDLASRLDEPPLLIDIREPDELMTGHIPGAVHIPRGVLESSVERLDRATEIVLYCSGGNRSILAGSSLRTMGFTDVSSLSGGTMLWRSKGHPFAVPGTTGSADDSVQVQSRAEDGRYARQLVLPEIGPDGQRRLTEASVLVIGAGGLGSPVAMYLAAAGVGRIGIADADVVDVSNLQRQLLHDTGSIGRRKAESAASTLHRINPSIEVVSIPSRVDASNVMDLIGGHDIIVDATDTFPTRYLLNDAVLRARIPLVHGSVYRFEGQATVFDPYAGPCYRCLFPEPPPPHLAPNCATAGVLGSVTGIVGSIQATEALKLLLGIGEALVGSLLTIDTLANEWTTLRFEPDPGCPACRDQETPPILTDYDDACLPMKPE